MGPDGRKHRKKHRRHRRGRDRGYRGKRCGNRSLFHGKLASTVYGALLIIAIVLVSFGFPLVLLGVVFTFEGMSYHPSLPGLICMVSGVAGVVLGILMCWYTHKRTHRVSQNQVGVAPVVTSYTTIHGINYGVPADARRPSQEPANGQAGVSGPHGDLPAPNISWSELSLGSRDSSFAGEHFEPEPTPKLSRVFAIYPRLHEPVFDASRPPQPPDNYTVPPLSATPPVNYKVEEEGEQSSTKTSTNNAKF